jgi:hypothetical protein
VLGPHHERTRSRGRRACHGPCVVDRVASDKVLIAGHLIASIEGLATFGLRREPPDDLPPYRFQTVTAGVPFGRPTMRRFRSGDPLGVSTVTDGVSAIDWSRGVVFVKFSRADRGRFGAECFPQA